MLPVRNFRTGTVALLLAGAVALGGCSTLPVGENATSHAPTAPATTSTPTETAGPIETPMTPAQEFSAKLTASLGDLAAGTKSPNRVQMNAAMLEAGAAEDTLEVSVDTTPTGLAVDAIEAASLVEGECVVGQVRNGQVSVSLLPVLATGRCFVGDVH